MELVSSPNPHFIPGYTGFCPQYKYRLGNTYGTTTHKVLLDPTVHHSQKLVLSDRTVDDYYIYRPPARDIEIVNERQGHSIYRHPMIPGYEGFVPTEHAQFGQRYSVQATEALSAFEKAQTLNRIAQRQIAKIGYLQDNQWDPKTLEDKELTQTQFKLPLLEVQPECGARYREMLVTEAPLTPPKQSESPYFSDNSDPEKYLKSGFTGHVPFGYASFGKTNKALTHSTLCDFTNNYKKRLSNEWAPVQIDRPVPPALSQPSEIYQKHIGQLPNYTGHIPGAIFRYGKTYGNDSRDAKRWLRGHFST